MDQDHESSMFEANSQENTSTSNQESLCLPTPSLLAAPSPSQPMARILQGIVSQSVPGGLWMEIIHSTPGKGRTFALIPSTSQALKTLSLLPQRFYTVIFHLLSKGLASALFSLCLPYPCLLLAPTPAKLAQAAAHLPATTPRKHSAPF